MDALTQLIEPFESKDANPLTDGVCREGMMRVARSLAAAYRDGTDLATREDMAIAALFSGLSGLAGRRAETRPGRTPHKTDCPTGPS